MELAGFNVVEIGKVTTIIGNNRALWGAAAVTNTTPDHRCPLCSRKPKKHDAWPFWPLVGLVCVDCSRAVCEATPWEPLELWPDGSVMTCITRRDP